MRRSEYVELMDSHYATITEINRTKGHDYAGNDDALANFKEQAKALGLDPQQVWGVFAGKHWSAIMTFIREGDVKSEPIEGRIHDVILYCFLLLGLIEEGKNGSPSAPTPSGGAGGGGVAGTATTSGFGGGAGGGGGSVRAVIRPA